jgi:hypothetical protein
MSTREMIETAATAVGAKPPRFGVPLAVLYAFGGVLGLASRVLRRDFPMNAPGCGCCTSCRPPTTVRRHGNSGGARVRPQSRSGGPRSSTSSKTPPDKP